MGEAMTKTRGRAVVQAPTAPDAHPKVAIAKRPAVLAMPVGGPPPLSGGPIAVPHPAPRVHPSKFSHEEERYLSELAPRERNSLLARFTACFAGAKARPRRFRILQSRLPNQAELLTLAALGNAKEEQWIDAALSLPLGVYAPPPRLPPSPDALATYLSDARAKMDAALLGQADAKDEVCRLLCQWITRGRLSTFAVGLEGPCGVGKTTFVKHALARVMERPFCFISLAGLSDACHLVGHSKTYEGAVCGRIAECVRTCGVLNPVLYFDELDKVSRTAKGDELMAILMALTDREQNAHFRDRYFQTIDIDLSDALCVFSYNKAADVHPVLLDRLNVVRFRAPSVDEKVRIASDHLVPRALVDRGLGCGEVSFPEKTLRYIVREHTREHGVRELDRCLRRVIGTLHVAANAPLVITFDGRVALPCVCTEALAKQLLAPAGDENGERDGDSSGPPPLMYA
jgi:hypothetical protein